MPLIAVNGCQFVDSVHGGQCIIKSGLSKYTKVCGKEVCLNGLVVTVAGGTIPGPQVAPIDITVNAQIIQHTTYEGEHPLALNEISSGQDMAEYQVGDKTVKAPVTIQIVDAGQQFVKAQ